jgi:hypothetical protein
MWTLSAEVAVNKFPQLSRQVAQFINADMRAAIFLSHFRSWTQMEMFLGLTEMSCK